MFLSLEEKKTSESKHASACGRGAKYHAATHTPTKDTEDQPTRAAGKLEGARGRETRGGASTMGRQLTAWSDGRGARTKKKRGLPRTAPCRTRRVATPPFPPAPCPLLSSLFFRKQILLSYNAAYMSVLTQTTEKETPNLSVAVVVTVQSVFTHKLTRFRARSLARTDRAVFPPRLRSAGSAHERRRRNRKRRGTKYEGLQKSLERDRTF